MINLGAEAGPDQIILEAQRNNVDAILISTHNGMALDYARRLKEHMDHSKVAVPVVLAASSIKKWKAKPCRWMFPLT